MVVDPLIKRKLTLVSPFFLIWKILPIHNILLLLADGVMAWLKPVSTKVPVPAVVATADVAVSFKTCKTLPPPPASAKDNWPIPDVPEPDTEATFKNF